MNTPSRIKLTAPRDVKAPRAPKAPKPSKRLMQIRRYVAGFTGGVGVSALGLSVVHCTDAIHQLMPKHNVCLAAAMAVVIDAGMIASELSELIGHDEPALVSWARRYMYASILLSMILNAYANVLGSSGLVANVLAGLLGAIIPALVFMLFKVAGHMAK